MINFSEILWKSGGTKKEGRGTGVIPDSSEIQVVFGLHHAPVEKVQLGPGVGLPCSPILTAMARTASAT